MVQYLNLNGEYVSDEEFQKIMALLDLNTVPYLFTGKYSKEKQDSFLGMKINNTKVPHEGVVVKHISGDRQKIAKVISPEYLIFAEKHDIGDSH